MVPTFDKNGDAYAGTGSTVCNCGTILHPLQKAGIIPRLGSAAYVPGQGTSLGHFLYNVSKYASNFAGSGGTQTGILGGAPGTGSGGV